MSVFKDISAALDRNLNDMAGKPPIDWENQGYEPANGTLYVRPTIIPGDTVQASLGDAGQDVQVGVYQVDIFAKAGEGKNDALAMADLIADQFKRGTVLIYNTRNVRIQSASRLVAANTTDGWFQLSVQINYISFTEART